MNASYDSLESSVTADFGEWQKLAVELVGMGGGGNDGPPSIDTLGAESFDGVSDMYTKLESMMTAVRHEVSGLENMKAKIRDFAKVKEKLQMYKKKCKGLEDDNGHLKRKLDESDALINQFRIDMQRLNDLYTDERQKHAETQKNFLRQEQAFSHAQGELNFIQNELKVNAEMKKTIKDLKAKLSKAQEVSDEEKSQLQKNVFVLEQHVKDSEKVKAELGAHVWNLTEEVKKAKAHVEEIDAVKAQLESQLRQVNENISKGNESLKLQLQSEREAVERLKVEQESSQARHHALLSDMMDLRRTLKEKDDKIESLELSITSLQDGVKKEKFAVHSKLEDIASLLKSEKSQNAELEEKLRVAQQLYNDLEKSKSQTKKLLDQKSEAVEALELELLAAQNSLNKKENDLKQAIAQRNDEIQKSQTSSAHFDAMQAQIREGQSRYWDELQKMKESEVAVQEEIEHLTAELEEKRLLVSQYESEKLKHDEFYRSELSTASQISNALKDELEKRLDELSQIRRERDTLKLDKEKLVDQLNDFETTLKKNESMFQRTLELDRSKIQQEIKSKLGRLKNLEDEKEELLREMQHMVSQVTEAQKESRGLRQELDISNRSLEDIRLEIQTIKGQNTELLGELKMANRRETELRDQNSKIENQFKDTINKLESSVKDSKKQSAQQVMDISNQLKDVELELEQAKEMVRMKAETEKTALAESEKLRLELQMSSKSHEEMQQKMALELAVSKRDLVDHRNKMKIFLESKTKLESETFEARTELQRAEANASRMKEKVKELELKLRAAADESEAVKSEFDRVNNDYKRLKVKCVDLEEKQNKKTHDIDRIIKEKDQLERDLTADQKRLRAQLVSVEAELNDLKTLVPRLQRESLDNSSTAKRLQESTSSTVNNLLQELRSAENSLTSERKRAQEEIMNYHARLTEMQIQLERAKDEVQESALRTKQDKSDRDHRLILLESEVERTKSTLKKAEARVEELECLRQTDRTKMLEIKDKLSAAEAEAQTHRSELEVEQVHRAHLESRLKAAYESAASAPISRVMSHTENTSSPVQLNSSPKQYSSDDDFRGGKREFSNDLGRGKSTSYRKSYDEEDYVSNDIDESEDLDSLAKISEVDDDIARIQKAIRARVSRLADSGKRENFNNRAEYTNEEGNRNVDDNDDMASVANTEISVIEDSIEKTQSFIRQKLASKGLSTSETSYNAATTSQENKAKLGSQSINALYNRSGENSYGEVSSSQDFDAGIQDRHLRDLQDQISATRPRSGGKVKGLVSSAEEAGGSPGVMHSYSAPKLRPASPPKRVQFNEETFVEDEQRELRLAMNSVGFDDKGGIIRSNITYYGEKDLADEARSEVTEILDPEAGNTSIKVLSSRSKLKKTQKPKQRVNEEPSPYAALQSIARPSSRGDTSLTKLPRIPSPANGGGAQPVSASKFFLGALKS